MERINHLLASTVMASALTALAGCAGITSGFTVSQGLGATTAQAAARPVPSVQDCGVLDAGTPSRFVCDGKVYTSYQLAKLREDEAKKYASGQ
jgi:hypothetical protein